MGEQIDPCCGNTQCPHGGGEDGGVRAELMESPWHTMGTRCELGQEQEMLRSHEGAALGSLLETRFFSPKAEKGGDTQTGKEGTERYGGGEDTAEPWQNN